MYWHNHETMPDIVRRCIETWRKMNPLWKVTVMSAASTEGMPKPEGFSSLGIQHQSDWTRLATMLEHGGMWVDASCVAFKPIETFIDLNDDSMQGWETPFGGGSMETWGFAVPPQRSLAAKWKEHFEEAIAMGFEAYCRKEVAAGTYSEKLGANIVSPEYEERLPYLTFNIAWRKAYDECSYSVRLKPRANHDNGPLAFIQRFKWNTSKAVNAMCQEVFHDPPVMLKMRGPERNLVMERAATGHYSVQSSVMRQLEYPDPEEARQRYKEEIRAQNQRVERKRKMESMSFAEKSGVLGFKKKKKKKKRAVVAEAEEEQEDRRGSTDDT